MFALLLLAYSNPVAVVLFLIACVVIALRAGRGDSTPQKRSKSPAKRVAGEKGGKALTNEGARPAGTANFQSHSDAPKRGPGRPRKNPAPDPDAPKRPRGRPRKSPPPAVVATEPAKQEPAALPAVSPVMQPEEFIKSLSA